eukprot:328076-Prymnesium_polylepis.1
MISLHSHIKPFTFTRAPTETFVQRRTCAVTRTAFTLACLQSPSSPRSAACACAVAAACDGYRYKGISRPPPRRTVPTTVDQTRGRDRSLDPYPLRYDTNRNNKQQNVHDLSLLTKAMIGGLGQSATSR